MESPEEGQKPGKQDSSFAFWRPQSSVPAPVHCLTGAAKVSGDFPQRLSHSVVLSLSDSEVFPEGLLCARCYDLFI